MLEKKSIKKILKAIFRISFVGIVIFMMYIPILIIFYQSFNSTANSIIPLEWGGFTLNNYLEIVKNRQLYTSILDSLLVSLWTTALATIFGLFISIGINALSKKNQKRMDFLNQIPMMNSEIVTGISIMIIFSLIKPLFPNVFGFTTMLVAHVFFTIPYVVLMILPKLQQTDQSLYEAAIDLGCPPMKSLFKVIIPSLKSAILMGALVAFTLSIDDFVISFYTQGNGFSNFSNYIYSSYTKKNFSAGAYAFNSLLTFITLGLCFIISLKQTKKKNKKGENK